MNDDLVRRSELIRLLDKLRIRKIVDGADDISQIWECEDVVLQAPAVKLYFVLCGNCKYYHTAKNGVNGICDKFYNNFDVYDFCSQGVMREDG